jgi:hypothetical protein
MSRPHLHPPRKTVRSFLDFVFEGRFHLQYLPMKKKTLKGDHFSSRYGGSKIQKDSSNVCVEAPTPVRISICQKKMIKVFYSFLSARHF